MPVTAEQSVHHKTGIKSQTKITAASATATDTLFVPTSAVRNIASFKLNSGFSPHSAISSGPLLIRNITTVV